MLNVQKQKKYQQERETLSAKQEAAIIQQHQAQQKSLARGIKGLWQRITGERLCIARKNELEALHLHQRNQQAMDDLIFRQLEERMELQKKLEAHKEKYALERNTLKHSVAAKLGKKQAQLLKRQLSF